MGPYRNPFAWLVIILAFLAGCAQLGAPAPTSVGQSIYYAQSTEIALMQSLDNAVLAGTVNKGQATQAQSLISQIDVTLTAARAANLAGNTAQAQSQLAAANAMILQLQSYLAAQGVKTK